MTQQRESWDEFFLGLAAYMATRSKDPSTQTGAVIVAPPNRIVSVGYNGFPARISDDPAVYADREQKYSKIIHCEMNAAKWAREPLDGYTLYTYPFMSCDRCFVHMLNEGITRFVAPRPNADQLTRWGDAFEKTKTYAREAGVELLELDYTSVWTRTS